MLSKLALAVLLLTPMLTHAAPAPDVPPALPAVAERSPRAAHARQQQGAVLLDVREDDERAHGMAEGAVGIAMGILTASPMTYLPDQHAEILLICRSGRRSRQVAEKLLQQGYTQVFSIQGGTLRWQEDGLPMVIPEK